MPPHSGLLLLILALSVSLPPGTSRQKNPLIIPPPVSFRWFTVMAYGNGFASPCMVMGGMWSLYVLTEVMIFMVVVRRVEAVARRTLARSVGSTQVVSGEKHLLTVFSFLRKGRGDVSDL